MASSNRSWTALPLFARLQIEKGTSSITHRNTDRNNILEEILIPSSQTLTETRSAVHVPNLPYAATTESQDSLVTRQLPIPTTRSSTNSFANSFEMHNTFTTLENAQCNPVSPMLHQHTAQEHSAEHLNPTTSDEISPHVMSKKSMSVTTSSSQQPGLNPLEEYGIPLHNSSVSVSKAWCCGFPGCNSQVIFTRACDLHKHYKRHSQRFYCRKASCSRSAEGITEGKLSQSGASGPSNTTPQDQVSGSSSRARHRWFASKKDRDRHEAKHSPRIQCTWRGSDGEHCSRVFSRLDNMKDHIRRVHKPTMDHHINT